MSVTGVRRALSESVSGLPRAFWWLWTSTLVNRLGAFVATFMALYLTLDRGYSASYAGLVVALHGLGGVISSLGAGVMTDRLGRRPTLLVAQTATALSVALLGFVRDPVAIAAVAFLVGMASNASRPAVQAMMADIVRPEDRIRAFSLNYWAINLGFAVSSAGAGFIAEVSYLAGFLIEAGMTLLCAVLVFVKLPESRPGAAARRTRRDEGGVRLPRHRAARRPVHGRRRAVLPHCPRLPAGLPRTPGRHGRGRLHARRLRHGHRRQRRPDRRPPAARHTADRAPRPAPDARRLLAARRVRHGLTAFAGSVGVFALTVCVWTLAEIVNAPVQTGLVVRLSPVRDAGATRASTPRPGRSPLGPRPRRCWWGTSPRHAASRRYGGPDRRTSATSPRRPQGRVCCPRP
ncbi:MFS family permease OS=Streptomyces albaduncus OX=68172 GN=FHS32_004020 PE=4 SV=1 [Streptomyces griseoloalbus]